MKKETKLRFSKTGVPDEKLWNEGWVVSVIGNIFGYLILKYTKHFKTGVCEHRPSSICMDCYEYKAQQKNGYEVNF